MNRKASVKICGITNLDDALSAIELGADALGFNFYQKSSRFIPPEIAGGIIRQLPKQIKVVGIFVQETVNNVLKAVETADLNAVQLHGRESPSYVRGLAERTDAEIIVALPCNEKFTPIEMIGFGPVSILLDSFTNGKFGGTGSAFNWERARFAPDLTRCLYLAGGLTPENVAEAVEKVRPHFVDVASGVESSPGRKDSDKVRAFITNAKNA